jgi:hypothetical protein
VLRVITMLGFPPAIWFAGDSIDYVRTVFTHRPSLSRESGYSIFLFLLRPLHGFAVVTAVQHLMGLAIGVMIYALLRRYRLPRWGAALAALPVLLDVYQIQLEQELLPDILFGFLFMAAVTLCVYWRDEKRPIWATAGAALLLALASLCWPVGLPLLLVLLVVLVIRKAGWRAVTAAVLAGAVPLVLYLGWFDKYHHRVAFNTASGVFLWSRTMTFAQCKIIKPPPDERPLCPGKPIDQRQAASLWIWQKHTPLTHMDGKFTVSTNQLAENFARRAILAQPLGYAGAVLDGFGHSFSWNRVPLPTKLMSERYQFTLATRDWDHLGTPKAIAIVQVQHEYTGGHLAFTKRVAPFAGIMIAYQRVFYIRGPMLAVLMLMGLAAIGRAWRAGGYRRRRGWGGGALFPWLTGLAILLVPNMTADFSLRYLVPALPATCIAAAFLFLRNDDPAEQGAVERTGVVLDQVAQDQGARDQQDEKVSTGPMPAQA